MSPTLIKIDKYLTHNKAFFQFVFALIGNTILNIGFRILYQPVRKLLKPNVICVIFININFNIKLIPPTFPKIW